MEIPGSKKASKDKTDLEGDLWSSTQDGSEDHPKKAFTQRGFRPDVEGLRAVAIGAVLLYHAGLPFARGGYVGVDVFFVISGFLITGLIVGEMEKTGTLSLTRFYSRRVKRLLPMVVVVLATVAGLSWILFSPVRMEEASGDVIAAGLYVINWRLAAQAVDYSAVGLQTSPVQHFWSLAVEEQFYILWPTLLLAVTWWSRRGGRSLRPALTAALTVVALSSFIYGAHLTDQEVGAAYFSTLTRGWELALGGALAIAPVSRLKLPRIASALMAWVGVGAIVWAVLRFSDNTPFPGISALLPTLGTAAIILAGSVKNSFTLAAPSRLLTLAPVRHVGRISYSWYLWHWPLLVFAAAQWGKLSPLGGLAVVGFSYIPTVLSHHLVENPFHHSRVLSRYPQEALGLGAACTATSVALGMLLFAATPNQPTASSKQAKGAADVTHGSHDLQKLQKSAKAVRPDPRKAKDDRSEMYADGCLLGRPQKHSPKPPRCVYGDTSSKTTVVLFGDSHAMQYFPALNRIAKKRHWRLIGLTKGGCTPAEVNVYDPGLGRGYSECDAWRENTLQRIVKKEHPSLVVTSSLDSYRLKKNDKKLSKKASGKALEKGYVATLKKLKNTGASVVVIKDNPHPHEDVPDCVSGNLHHLKKCAIPRSKAFDYPPVNARAARDVRGVSLIDPNPVLCLKKECPAVIGNVLVYRNGTHLTATYVRTLTPWLGKRLPKHLGS